MWAPAALALWVGLLAFPGSYEPPRSGLDPSWVIGLNLFSWQGFRFGRDLIFTYGPLGYIVRPLDVGNHLLVGNVVRAVLHAGLFALVAFLLVRRERRSSVVLFLLAFPLIAIVERELDYEILGLVVLLLSVAAVHGATRLLVPAAILCSLLPFMKFGTGVCALTTLACGLAVCRWHQVPRRWIAITVAVLLLGLGLLAILLLGGPSSILYFLRRSAQIASGYNDAMASVGPLGHLAWAALLVAVLVTAMVGAGVRSASGTVLLVSLVPVLCSLKHAFVRQDDAHELIAFGVLLWSSLAALLLAATRREQLCSGGLLLTTVTVAVIALSPAEVEKRRSLLPEILSGRQGMRWIGNLVQFPAARRDLRARGERLLAGEMLPDGWRDLIGTERVLVVPWEITLCWANALDCVPFPTLQMYSAYTPELDRWSAQRLGEDRPTFVLLKVDAIDERNMLWDCPATWDAVLRGWEPFRSAPSRGLLLLRRRAVPREVAEGRRAERTTALRDWVQVPEGEGPVRVSLGLNESGAGTLRRILFRPAPVVLHAITRLGRVRTYRLVLATARSGFLLDAMPVNVEDLPPLFEGSRVPDPVRAFRLAGPGLSGLEPRMSVAWEVLPEAGPRISPPASAARTERIPGEPMAHLEWINGVYVGSGQPRISLDMDQEAKVTLTGWAIDRDRRTRAEGVVLIVDGGRLEIPAEYGIVREDVASHWAEPRYAESGFRASIPLDQLGRGLHRIELSVTSGDGRTAQVSSTSVELEVR